MTDTRTKLLEAALREIALHGPDKPSIAVICHRAGFSSGVFFNCWINKSAFLSDMKTYIREQCPTEDLIALDGIQRALQLYCGYSEHPVAVHAYVKMILCDFDSTTG